jgi:hypothetical protein
MVRCSEASTHTHPTLAPFTAKYTLYAKGFSAGEGTRTLGFSRDGKLQFESLGKTTGILSWFKKIEVTERTVFTREDGKIRPDFKNYNILVFFLWKMSNIFCHKIIGISSHRTF